MLHRQFRLRRESFSHLRAHGKSFRAVRPVMHNFPNSPPKTFADILRSSQGAGQDPGEYLLRLRYKLSTDTSRSRRSQLSVFFARH